MTQEKRTVLPTKFATEWDDNRQLPKHEARNYSEHLPVDAQPGRMHAPATANAPLEDKVYYFPESYNALRKELSESWPTLWQVVGHAMAFDAPKFIEMMDAALEMKTTFDSAKVGAICHRYWNALRMKKGFKSIPYGEADGSIDLTDFSAAPKVELLDQFGRPLK